jgi:hypothetical protein
MRGISKSRILGVVIFLVVGMAFVALHLSQAQVPGGLDLSVPPLQVINQVGYSIYQHKYSSGIYTVPWRSGELWGTSGPNNFSIGDADNDGQRELVAVVNYATREERVKGKKVYYFDQNIVVFENGCPYGGMPDRFSPSLGESISAVNRDTLIADVDNDGDNEFVLIKGSVAEGYHIEIYDLSDGGFSLIKRTEDSPNLIFSIDAGDADNDGENEIVLSTFYVGAPTILKFDKESQKWTSRTAKPVPSEFWQPGYDMLGLDYARVRDADNAIDASGNKDNEIVGGGNNDRLMVWKYNKLSGDYDLKFVSEDLGGFTQGVDAGDIDGDGSNEVVIGSCRTGQGKKRAPGRLFIFSFNGLDYELADSFDLGFDPSNLCLGELDNDGRPEIAFWAGAFPSLRIFDFIGQVGTGNVQLAYGGDGSGLEIR